MSENNKNEIYGKLSREKNELAKNVAYLEKKLSEIGKNLEATGKQLQTLKGRCPDFR